MSITFGYPVGLNVVSSDFWRDWRRFTDSENLSLTFSVNISRKILINWLLYLRKLIATTMESTLDSNKPENRDDFITKKPSKKTYEFDDLLRLVGGFGCYPMMLYAFMCLMTVPIGLQQLVLVFYGASPSFHCTASTNNSNNSPCSINQCCANCTEYEFNGEFTSAVSEVRLRFCYLIFFVALFMCSPFTILGLGAVS